MRAGMPHSSHACMRGEGRHSAPVARACPAVDGVRKSAKQNARSPACTHLDHTGPCFSPPYRHHPAWPRPPLARSAHPNLGMGLPWHWQHSSRWQVPATPSRFFQCGGPAFSPATGDFKRIQDAIQDALEREGVRAESDPEASVSLPSGWARVDVADIMEGQAVQHCMFVCVVCVVSCLCLCSMMRK